MRISTNMIFDDDRCANILRKIAFGKKGIPVAGINGGGGVVEQDADAAANL